MQKNNFKTNDEVYLVRSIMKSNNSVDEKYAIVKGKITMKGANKMKLCVDGFDFELKNGETIFTNSRYTINPDIPWLQYELFDSEKDAEAAYNTKKTHDTLVLRIKSMIPQCNNNALQIIYEFLCQEVNS